MGFMGQSTANGLSAKQRGVRSSNPTAARNLYLPTPIILLWQINKHVTARLGTVRSGTARPSAVGILCRIGPKPLAR